MASLESNLVASETSAQDALDQLGQLQADIIELEEARASIEAQLAAAEAAAAEKAAVEAEFDAAAAELLAAETAAAEANADLAAAEAAAAAAQAIADNAAATVDTILTLSEQANAIIDDANAAILAAQADPDNEEAVAAAQAAYDAAFEAGQALLPALEAEVAAGNAAFEAAEAELAALAANGIDSTDAADAAVDAAKESVVAATVTKVQAETELARAEADLIEAQAALDAFVEVNPDGDAADLQANVAAAESSVASATSSLNVNQQSLTDANGSLDSAVNDRSNYTQSSETLVYATFASNAFSAAIERGREVSVGLDAGRRDIFRGGIVVISTVFIESVPEGDACPTGCGGYVSGHNANALSAGHLFLAAGQAAEELDIGLPGLRVDLVVATGSLNMAAQNNGNANGEAEGTGNKINNLAGQVTNTRNGAAGA